MIYLDNASTTMVDTEVGRKMMSFMCGKYGNAGSIHKLGTQSAEAVWNAREQVANLIGAEAQDIVFTSGGTEANNLALLGVVDYLRKVHKNTIMLSEIEHDSLINASKTLIKRGFRVMYIPPNSDGIITTESVANLIDTCDDMQDVGLVSVMHVNNETGVMNEVAGIGKECAKRGVLFHTDCVQSAGCCDINVDTFNCDMLSISSHKIHGPKGVGALYVRDKNILTPIINGGNSQEFGLRGGTENVPGIVGFGEACRLAKYRIIPDKSCQEKIRQFVSTLSSELDKRGILPLLHINCENSDKYKSLSIRFDGMHGETLVLAMSSYDVCISAGSACRSKESIPSRVLTSIGLSPEEARSSIRISFSKYNSYSDIVTAATKLAGVVAALSEINQHNN